MNGAANPTARPAGGAWRAARSWSTSTTRSLNGNESRNATIQGCQNDYAIVGTSALFLTQVDDIVNCKDQAGQATGIPDLSAVTTGVPESCSPMAFPAYGTAILCDTVTQNPQSFLGNQGPREVGDLAEQGPAARRDDRRQRHEGRRSRRHDSRPHREQAGIKADQGDPVVAVSGRDPQSVFTPIVQKMKQDGSNWR